MRNITIDCVVNGRAVSADVSPRWTLAAFLRDTLNLTGTHVGCGHGVCGACTVLLDGRTARACLVLAPSVAGRRVDTIEGLADSDVLRRLQDAFMRHGGLQCGYCTPGMLLTAHELLADTSNPSRSEIRDAIGGQYCRCTGYAPIVDAIAAAAAEAGEDKP